VVPNSNNTSSSNSTTTNYTADGLLLLLKQVRFHDASVQQIVLEKRSKRLPAAYLTAVLEAVATNPHVKRVRLHKTGVDDSTMDAIAEIIENSSSNALTDLQLTKSDITDKGGLVIAAALRKAGACCNIRRLVLEGSQMTSNVGLNEIVQAAAGIPSLQILKIGKHKLEQRAIDSITSWLKQPDCAVRKLDLRSCNLRDTGAAAIAQALVDNTSLQSLCLGRNDLHDAAVREIARALRRNCHLITLDLQYNFFTDQGATAFCETLQTANDSFQKLKLRHCDNVSDGMKEHLLDLLLLHAHGPDLAQKTKLALESLLLLEEEEEEESESHSHSSALHQKRDDNENDESRSNLNHAFVEEDDQDGGRDGVIREVSSQHAHHQHQHHYSRHHQQLSDCVICYDGPADAALLPCTHRCCETCSAKLKTCHMCRETIVKVFPLFQYRRKHRHDNTATDTPFNEVSARSGQGDDGVYGAI